MQGMFKFGLYEVPQAARRPPRGARRRPHRRMSRMSQVFKDIYSNMAGEQNAAKYKACAPDPAQHGSPACRP